MRVLGVTLARGGSKGVPKKNLYPLNGIPLLEYTIREAAKSKWIDRYVVSSDDDAILNLARKIDILAYVHRRDAHLSEDNTPTLPALRNAVKYVESLLGEFDIIAELRCTNPFKTAKQIDGAIEKLIASDADVVVGVEQVFDKHPSRLKTINEEGYLEDIWPEPSSGRRQDLEPPVYVRNGSFYILTRQALDKGILFQGGKILPYVMPPSVNIDTMQDIKVAERLLQEDDIRSRDRISARGQQESSLRTYSTGIAEWSDYSQIPVGME